MMGLTLAERRAVTEATAIRYLLADKRTKGIILDGCAPRRAGTVTMPARRSGPRCSPNWYRREIRGHRSTDRMSLPRLTVCWTVLATPAGKRLAPMLTELVAVLRHFGELVIDEDTAALLMSMSAATIDRRLAGERAKYQLKGRASTKPGSLLKSQIPVRTWA